MVFVLPALQVSVPQYFTLHLEITEHAHQLAQCIVPGKQQKFRISGHGGGIASVKGQTAPPLRNSKIHSVGALCLHGGHCVCEGIVSAGGHCVIT